MTRAAAALTDLALARADVDQGGDPLRRGQRAEQRGAPAAGVHWLARAHGRGGHRAPAETGRQHIWVRTEPTGAAHPERDRPGPPRAAVGRVPASSARDRRHQGERCRDARARSSSAGGEGPADAPRRVTSALALAVGGPRPGGLPAPEGPADRRPRATVVTSFVASPGAVAGANDWKCRPTAAHPEPVVLVHATGVNLGANWVALSPMLKNAGYCVFAFNYGFTGLSLNRIGGLGEISASAATMKAFVDQVLATTGASKVDVVGHSQGGMMPSYYIKRLGGASKVRTLGALAQNPRHDPGRHRHPGAPT